MNIKKATTPTQANIISTPHFISDFISINNSTSLTSSMRTMWRICLSTINALFIATKVSPYSWHRPSLFIVMVGMLFQSCYFKILNTIIQLISIFMVNNFRLLKLSTQMLFHYVTMFPISFAINPNHHIAMSNTSTAISRFSKWFKRITIHLISHVVVYTKTFGSMSTLTAINRTLFNWSSRIKTIYTTIFSAFMCSLESTFTNLTFEFHRLHYINNPSNYQYTLKEA